MATDGIRSPGDRWWYLVSGIFTLSLYNMADEIGYRRNPAIPTSQNELPLSPLYDSMTTNIPHPIMAYTTFPFPSSTPLFPAASIVQQYLHDYASHFHLLPHVHLNTTVEDASWDESEGVWRVRVLGPHEPTAKTHLFDHLIVANGHFRRPRYPEISGLSAWIESGKILHSAWYRRPSDLGDARKVVVIGNGPSGMDVATEIAAEGKTVIHSMDMFQMGSEDPSSLLKKRSRTVSFSDVDSGTVIFEDGSVEQDIDKVVLATGYEYSIPFLSSIVSESKLDNFDADVLASNIHNSSYHLYPLAKHIFPLVHRIPPSRLAFIGLLLRGTPFPLFEAQARAIVKVFREPHSLHIENERIKVVARLKQLAGEGLQLPVILAKDWHRPTEPETFVYRDELNEFAGMKDRVSEWEKDMWKWKVELRQEWRKLEKSGESKQWVNGVHDEKEWIKIMYEVLERAGVELRS